MLTKIEELSDPRSNEETQRTFLETEESLPDRNQSSMDKKIGKTAENTSSKTQKHNWGKFSLKEETRRFEAKYIKQALLETEGKVTSAARLLGISHQTLSQLLKQRHQSLLEMKKPRQKRSDYKKSKK
jgi:DNA-binding NtrC family response regulator